MARAMMTTMTNEKKKEERAAQRPGESARAPARERNQHNRGAKDASIPPGLLS